MKMSGNKEGRLHGSGTATSRPDHAPRQGDDRTRTRRLADVRRGNTSRHQLELLTSARGGVKHHSSTPSSWASAPRVLETWSAKERGEGILQKPPGLESRHSCPALPAISSSLGIYHDINDSRNESGNIGMNMSSELSLNIKTKQMKQQESLNQNLPKEEQRMIRTGSRGIIPNSRHSSPKSVGSLSKNKIGKSFSNLTSNSVSQKNRNSKSFQNESKPTRTTSVQNDTNPIQSSETHLHANETESSNSNKDGKETGPATVSRRRYSVLLNGGTLATNAPYVDRIGGETLNRNTITKAESDRQPDEFGCRLPKTTTDSSGAKDRERRLQKPTTAPRKRESVPSPSRRRGRHLRSHKELFAFQQDLLLPRYRKLAGITGNDADDVMAQSERPSADESQGNGGNTRRSDAREVFEKVRLIIKGPQKVATVTKPTDHKVREMMPIYLKSGLPCGYVDSSNKCDAWLYANNFDD